MSHDIGSVLGDGDGPAVITARQTTGNVHVGREGEVVTLRIGNSTIRLKWKDAFRIGHWMTVKATEAKWLAGEYKRHLIEK